MNNCFLNASTISGELVKSCNLNDRVSGCTSRPVSTLTTSTITLTSRKIEQKPKDSTTTIIFGVIGGVVILIILGLIAFYVIRNSNSKPSGENTKMQSQSKIDDEDVNYIKNNNLMLK